MKRMIAWGAPFLLACSLPLTNPVTAQDKESDSPDFSEKQIEFFESKVRPLLVEYCFECHGPDSTPIEGGLSLQSRKAILAGGDTGPAIVPGHPDKSLFIDAINYGDVYEMPPDTKMSDEDIATLTDWVKQGAPWPKSTDVDVTTAEEFDIAKLKASHWCWKPVRKNIAPPNVKNSQWPRSPIDNFILRGIEKAGLSPAEPADKRTLIRRVYFDLIGLPPTPEQIQAFLKDSSRDAFENVVDGLLASDHFGERWARHWMDLTRYAETGGHEFDYPIPYAYRYRDYLIRAFNEDVPYRQLIHEHLAGDLLTKPRRNSELDYNESVLGTGFWFLGEAKHGAVDSRGEEARTMDNQIDVMSKTFFGLTVACARCHDHKFDAISTEDYYSLAGFLQSSRRQAAMLDPGRKIEKQLKLAQPLLSKANKLVPKLTQELRYAKPDHLESYLGAAVQFLRSDPTWNQKATSILEGESMTQIMVSGGHTQHQVIKPRKGFKWSGDKHNWWKHGKPDDHWELEFTVPDLRANTTCQVSAVFTKARDYGAAAISINDDVLIDRMDFFDPELTTTGIVKLGDVELKPGKNRLRFKLARPNQDAIASNMVGLDYLEVIPAQPIESDEAISLDEIAKTRSLDVDTLERLVAAIRQIRPDDKNHPMFLLYQISKSEQTVDANFIKRLAADAKATRSRHDKWMEDSVLFADFSQGIPSDWFQTGFALETDTDAANLAVASAGPLLNPGGIVNSGTAGGNYFGVLRSPTFEIKHEKIHYRIRGNNVTIRLIIDGFTMDEYNPLLYAGCKFNIKPGNHFVWQTQAGDIKNHIGSRAHIEIIDHGDGYFAIDEIRFSKRTQPIDAPDDFVRQLDPSKELAGLVNAIANSVSSKLKQVESPASAPVFNWLVENELVDIATGFNRPALSSLETGTDQKTSFVSTRSTTVTRSESSKIASQLKTIRAQVASINEKTPRPELALAMTDGSAEEEYIFIRGNHKTLGKQTTRRYLAAISDRPLNPSDGSGRLQLARKITAPNNPLTTRVAVNRVWHHVMGRGIVETVDNFGVLGKLPTHPELLDYLAAEFERDGWSIKRLIKRIVMSRTYQMSSKPNPAAVSIDPDNNLLHRSHIKRLPGEAIRDSILSISGRLDTKMFGPPVPIHLTSFMTGRGRPRKSGPMDGEGRRSIYVAVRRNFLSPMMLAFDTPIPFNAIGKRNNSNVPAQALIMMNDPFIIGEAGRWAEQLIASNQSRQQRIQSIYETALGRPPSTDELENAESFLKIQAKELGLNEDQIDSNRDVWRDLCHVVFNLKEFIFLN